MIILIDVDGVVADFTSAVLHSVRRHTGREYTAADVTEWSIRDALELCRDEWAKVVSDIESTRFGLGLDLYNGAVCGVLRLARRPDVEAYFVTAPFPSSPTWCFDRAWWIRNAFGSELGNRVIFTEHKHLVRGDILIEDKPETIETWRQHNPEGHGLLWVRHWNFAHRLIPEIGVRSWDEVEASVDHFIALNEEADFAGVER